MKLIHRSQRWLAPHSPGVVVRVNRGLYDHVGLIGDRRTAAGEVTVLSLAPGRGAVEEPLSAFIGNAQIIQVDGYLGTLSSEEVMSRARSMWPRIYSLFDFNCEHFVRYAHGLPAESPQVKAWIGVTLLTLAVAAVATRS